jgi:hypothetical protein
MFITAEGNTGTGLMNVQLDRALRQHFGSLAGTPQVRAAVLVLSSAQEIRYLGKGAGEELWHCISPLVWRICNAGHTELLNESVQCEGVTLQRLVQHCGGPIPAFIVALAEPPADAHGLSVIRNALDAAAMACLREMDKPRWR